MKVKGSVVKVLMALGELPNFTACPGTDGRMQHTGGIVINPSVDYLETAWDDCKRGHPAAAPFMDCYIQTATEDGLRPPGKHTMSLFVQYAPYDLAEGTWDERRDEIGANIIDTLAEFAPNIPSAIEHIEVLGPPDIERIVGITGGNIFHGEILPDQMFGYRPVPGLQRLPDARSTASIFAALAPGRAERSLARRVATARSRRSAIWAAIHRPWRPPPTERRAAHDARHAA